MIRGLPIATILMVTTIAVQAGTEASAATKNEARLGKWFCTVDAIVGLRGGRNGKPRFGGQINLPKSQQNFFVHIKRLDYPVRSVGFGRIAASVLRG